MLGARVTDRPALHLLQGSLQVGVVDRLLHEHPAHRVAALTGVLESAQHRLLDGKLEIGVGQDDGRRIAAELQVHGLGPSAGRDAPADGS